MIDLYMSGRGEGDCGVWVGSLCDDPERGCRDSGKFSPVLPCPALRCPALRCAALCCPALSRPVLPGPVPSCPAVRSVNVVIYLFTFVSPALLAAATAAAAAALHSAGSGSHDITVPIAAQPGWYSIGVSRSGERGYVFDCSGEFEVISPSRASSS